MLSEPRISVLAAGFACLAIVIAAVVLMFGEPTPETTVRQAEQLASTGHCAEALALFSPCVAGAGPLQERALFGRALCRLEGGDAVGGRRDLSDYLDRFPRGRFVERAQAALKTRGEAPH